MNGSLAANAQLLAELSAVRGGLSRVGVSVPYPYLAQVRQAIAGRDWVLGAQDVSVHAEGAYTGEVSASMLADFGVGMVLVGHSERRQYHGETSAAVVSKALRAIAADMIAVVCVGESLMAREAGQVESVLDEQLAPVLDRAADWSGRLVLAYEPVWAIGTGKTATPQQAQAVHAFMRERLAGAGLADVSVLYGGSVKASNAGELFAMSDIDGGLIGGASLVAAEFAAIVAACGRSAET